VKQKRLCLLRSSGKGSLSALFCKFCENNFVVLHGQKSLGTTAVYAYDLYFAF